LKQNDSHFTKKLITQSLTLLVPADVYIGEGKLRCGSQATYIYVPTENR